MELSAFNETPEGKPQRSVTYLTEEEEAPEQKKEKKARTLYTHKLHCCVLRGWRLLIKRGDKERGKAG